MLTEKFWEIAAIWYDPSKMLWFIIFQLFIAMIPLYPLIKEMFLEYVKCEK